MSKKKFVTLMICLAMAGASMGVMSACGGDDSTPDAGSSVESTSSVDEGASTDENSSSDDNPIVVEYKVTFNSLGGSDVKAQFVKNGAKATKPEDPTREDYTFVEWQLNGNTYDFSTRVTGDITLTAKWEKNAPAKFTVSFVVEGETEPFHTAEVETGKKVMAPADEPMRGGYVFDGWTLNGADYDFETPVTEALTLTAKWINLWTVTFDVGEGTAVEAVEVKDGDKLAIPETIPTRENYIFDGWMLNGEAYDFETPVTGALTLTAKWENAWTVTFDVGEGSAIDPITVKDGATVSAPATTWAGYYVCDWLYNGASYDFTAPVTGNITLTAVWDKAALMSQQFAVIAGAWNQPGTDFITATGDNEEVVVNAKLKGDRWRHPAVVLRNLASKEYYEDLIANGYTKLTFGLAVGGENAENVNDLYVFGKKLATYAKNADGVYAISIDMQFIVDCYDTIGALGTSVEGVPSKYADQMFIRWECNDSNATETRNYVFTISNAEYRTGVLDCTDIGVRINGYNVTNQTSFMAMEMGDNDEMIIGAKFQANGKYAPSLILRNLETKEYYEALLANGYPNFTFNLAVEGDVSDLYVFGKKLVTFAKNADGAYTLSIPVNHFVQYYETLHTIATSGEAVGEASSLNAKFITWQSPTDDWSSVREYVFTISNTAYTKGVVASDAIGIRINGYNMTTNTNYFTMDMGDNGEMVIGANFQANGTYAPALILRKLESKAYYENLLASGYTKFTFKLAVEGDTTDLYVFGKALNTFAEENGVYTIAIDLQHFVTYYETLSTIATSDAAVGQAGSLAAKFITWQSPTDDWATVRNYVFTISETEFSKQALYSENVGIRINGWNMSSDENYLNITADENGDMTITANFQANSDYAPALVYTNLKDKAYYENLLANGYTHLTFNLAVEGEVDELYVFGKKIVTFAKNADGAYAISIPVNHFVQYYDTMKTIATSPNKAGAATSLNAKFITWQSPADDWSSVRDYVFTISNSAYRNGALFSEDIGIRINGYNMTTSTEYMTMDTGVNGEMIVGAKFQANGTYAPALILRQLESKEYYETLIANGYTKFTFKLAVEGDLSDLYVFGKALDTFEEENGVYTITIDTQHFVTYYDTLSTIATSTTAVGQESSMAAKFITWKSPADEWQAIRNYVFTISNTEFVSM